MQLKKLNIVVCGTKFGHMYLSALSSDDAPFKLVGIVAKGSSRSRHYAREYGVPLYTNVDDLPSDVDVACVIVRSAIAGGKGTDLSLKLMERGIHVLQEHPLHQGDVSKCLNQSKAKGVCYHINSYYANVEPITDFINYIRKARERQQILFVDAIASFQTAYSLIDILGKALGGFKPYGFTDSLKWHSSLAASNKNDVIPFQCIQGIISGIPITIKLQNYYDPAGFDNYFLVMHRICIGMPVGNLTLVNTHGPVVWSRTFFVPGYEQQGEEATPAERKAIFASCREPSAVSFSDMLAPGISDIAAKHWPKAIRLALNGLIEEIETGSAPFGQSGDYLLDLSDTWGKMMKKFGYPQAIHIPEPSAPFPDPLSYAKTMIDNARAGNDILT